MLKALLFDMDGVVLDNNPWHKKAWKDYSRLLGIPLSDEEFATAVFGKTNEGILQTLLGDSLTDEEQFLHGEAKEAYYRAIYAKHFAIAKGLVNLLENAKNEGLKIAICSNAPKSNVDFTIQKGNIAHLIDEGIYAHLVARPKPAPDLYLKAMEMLGVTPAECVVFEDSPGGIAAGIAAGAKVIGITTTYSKEEIAPMTHRVITSFEELTVDQVRELLEK